MMLISYTKLKKFRIAALPVIASIFILFPMASSWADEKPVNSRDAVQTTGTDRDTIRAVQRRLSELGYEPGPADGLLGSRTANEIRRFQSDKNLAKTGVLNPETLGALDIKISEKKHRQSDQKIKRVRIGNSETIIPECPVAVGGIDPKTGRFIMKCQ